MTTVCWSIGVENPTSRTQMAPISLANQQSGTPATYYAPSIRLRARPIEVGALSAAISPLNPSTKRISDRGGQEPVAEPAACAMRWGNSRDF